jgi:hypothetical protein
MLFLSMIVKKNTILKTLLKSLQENINLQYANLQGAHLQNVNLQGANLKGANLYGADLDFSVLFFSCRSRKPETDERQRIQFCHHFLNWIKYSENTTEEEKEIFNKCKAYANRFHRTDVEKFD